MSSKYFKAKNNFILIVALAVTGTISVFLIYLSIVCHANVSESNEQIAKYREELEKAHAAKPAPVRQNRNNIQHDAELLEKKAFDIQQRFGKYFRNELISFASEIGVREKDLLNSFRAYYQSLPPEKQSHIEGIRDKAILQGFLEDVAKKKIAEPWKKFSDSLKTGGAKTLFDTKFNKILAQYMKDLHDSDAKMPAELQTYVRQLAAELPKMQADFKKRKLTSVTAPDSEVIVVTFCRKIGISKEQLFAEFGDDADSILQLKPAVIQNLSNQKFLKIFLLKHEIQRICNAADNFYTAVAKNTIQMLSKDDGYRFLLAALGLPRTEKLSGFSDKLRKYKNKIWQEKLIPGLESLDKINNLTFSDQAFQADVPDILRQILVREDFFRRVKRNKFEALREMREISSNPLRGTVVSGTYLEYKFMVKLEGTITAVRSLINDMQQAVKENRVFVIRDMQLRRLQVEVVDRLLKDQDLLEDEPLKLARDFQVSFKIADKEKKVQEKREDKDVQSERILASTYGKPQIGAENELLQTDLVFCVYLYIGDEVARVQTDSK